MHPTRFDALTRRLSAPQSRRSLLGGALGLLAGMLTAPEGEATRTRHPVKHERRHTHRGAQKRTQRPVETAKKSCRPAGHPCEGNQDGSCCPGLVCVASGPGTAKRCTPCPVGTVAHQGQCCTPGTCPPGSCGSPPDNCGNSLACGTCSSAVEVCVTNQCVPCGLPDEPCCAGDQCLSADLVCSGGHCVPCGHRGDPCCAGVPCVSKLDICVDGQCVSLNCGGGGERCCPDGIICAVGECVDGQCPR